MRILFSEGPTAEQAELYGLSLEDFDEPEASVWPDNIMPVRLFSDDLVHQWRHGFNGPIGLDYTAMPFIFRMNKIPRDDWPDTYDCIRVMESEALKQMKKD